MGSWTKVWLATATVGFALILTACGKDNGQGSVQANTAPPRANNCMNGQNCAWQTGQYPAQWTAYPRYANGAYNYSYYNGYNSGCGQYGQPYYDYYRGLICIPLTGANMNGFMTGSWAGGSYYQGCDMLYQWVQVYPNGLANPCYGRCYPLSNFNSAWGATQAARYGACQ